MTSDETAPTPSTSSVAPSGEGDAPVADRARTSPRAPRLRRVVAAVLVILAVLGVAASTLAVWSHSVVFDSDQYVRVVAPIAEDPEVRRAVSEYVADRALEASDLEARIQKALPFDSRVIAPALTGTLRQYLVQEVDRLLDTELARRLWADINRLGHRQLIAALRDENRFVTVGENDVKLNLLPLIAAALQRLGLRAPGLLERDVTLPLISPDTPPQTVRTLLQDALGRRLPEDFGTITVLRGSQGYEVKQALRQFNDLVTLVVVVTVALIVAALLVSVRRLRTALWLGLGALLGYIAVRVFEARIEKAVIGAITSEGGAAVGRAVLRSAIDSLNGYFVWVAVAGAIVAIVAFIAGRRSWLAAIERGVDQLFGVASDLTTPDTRVSRWMSSHLDLLRIGGVAVAIVVLLFVTGSLTAVIAVLVALVVFELALIAYAAGVPSDDQSAED